MSKKDMQPLLKSLREQGFDITQAKNSHLRVSRGGRKVQIPLTPSNPRSVKNSITRLKKIGYQP